MIKPGSTGQDHRPISQVNLTGDDMAKTDGHVDRPGPKPDTSACERSCWQAQW